MQVHQFLMDRYNKNLTITKNDFVFYTPKCEDFLEKIQFLPAFEDAKIIGYELERNIFAVERTNGQNASGTDVEEIQWITQNFDMIVEKAKEDENNTLLLEMPFVRDVRNLRLGMTDWLITRHSEEILMQQTPSLSAEQLQELNVYRQALRDLDGLNEKYDKETFVWPSLPSFLGADYIL